tara:strand:+ start:694 stop:1887 length:1194 start_codon:yes stop_codon:yes gene_type:complete
MSKQVDKKSGKEFELKKHSDIVAAAAAGGTINGKIARPVGIEAIPFRLKQGDQSSYFDITKVETSSIVRTDDGVVYVPYKKKNWQDMLIGDNSEIKTKFNSSSYLQISAAFASKISNIDGDFLITQIAEEFYTSSDGSPGSFVGPVTASYELRIPNTVTQSYSGIDNGDGVNFNIDNQSSFSTHTTFNIGNSLEFGNVTQSIFFTSSLHNFRNTGTISGSFTANPSSFSSPTSGSAVGAGSIININSSSASDSTYRKFLIKGRIAGDGDSGSLYSFLSPREIIIYSSSVEVRSGSFQYSATGNNAATASGVFKTIFYASGSTGPSGSYSGSGVLNTAPLGSPLHGDAALRTTASYGFYNVPGTTIVFTVSSSQIDNGGFASSGGTMIIPRFIRKLAL